MNFVLLPKRKRGALGSGEFMVGFKTSDPRCFYMATSVADAVEFAQDHVLTLVICRDERDRDELKAALEEMVLQ